MISFKPCSPEGDEPGGAPHQGSQAASNLGLHVREHVRDRLEGADLAAELLALLGVGERKIKRSPAPRRTARRGGHALDLQPREHHLPAFVLAADDAVARHAHVGEEYFKGADAAPPQHVELAHLEGRRVVVDEEKRHALAVMRRLSVFTYMLMTTEKTDRWMKMA